MSDTNATVQIPKDVIEPLVKSRLEAELVEALGGKDELVKRLVEGVLLQEVDDKGKRSTYSYDKDRTYLSWLCEDVLANETRKAIRAWLDEHRADFREALFAQLQTKRMQNSLARQLLEGFTAAAASDWNLKVSVDTKKDQ
jgi:hypothetical protein